MSNCTIVTSKDGDNLKAVVTIPMLNDQHRIDTFKRLNGLFQESSDLSVKSAISNSGDLECSIVCAEYLFNVALNRVTEAMQITYDTNKTPTERLFANLGGISGTIERIISDIASIIGGIQKNLDNKTKPRVEKQ